MLYIVPWTHNISYCSTSNVHVTFYNGHYQSPTVFGVYWKNNSEPLLMPCNSERYIRNIRFRNCHVFYSHFIFVWQSNAFPSLTIVSSVQMRGKGLGGGWGGAQSAITDKQAQPPPPISEELMVGRVRGDGPLYTRPPPNKYTAGEIKSIKSILQIGISHEISDHKISGHFWETCEFHFETVRWSFWMWSLQFCTKEFCKSYLWQLQWIY